MSSDEELLEVAVKTCNEYRRRHGCPDVKGSKKMQQSAQQYAEYLARNNLFQHSRGPYLENLAGCHGKTKAEAIRHACKMWYDEIKVYNYNNPGFSMQTGHFTAMVWKSLHTIGIGICWNPRSKWYVCSMNFDGDPKTNMAGQFRANVPRLLSAEEIRKNEEKRKEEAAAQEAKKAAKAAGSNPIYRICLEEHNKFRKLHGVPELKAGDEKIQKAAKDRAQLLASKNELLPDDSSYGDNMAYCNAKNEHEAVQLAVQMWYDLGRHHYDFSDPGYSSEAATFTQVIWKSTTSLGVGVAKGEKSWFVVCKYAPSGNSKDDFHGNVLPLKKTVVAKELEEMRQIMLDKINEYRKLHQAPDVSMKDKVLQELAQMEAERRASTKEETDVVTYYFVSLAWVQPETNEEKDDISGLVHEMVKLWYAAKSEYDFSNPEGKEKTTSVFTAMVWKALENVGIGLAWNESKARLHGVVYYPHHLDEKKTDLEYEQNVLPCVDDLKIKHKDVTVDEEVKCEEESVSTIEEVKSASDLLQIYKICLHEHNFYRKLHGVPALEIGDEKLQKAADERAKIMAAQNELIPDDDDTYGENMAYYPASNARDAVLLAVQMWYGNGRLHYNFNDPGYYAKTGLFTQVIWKSTTQLGVGVAKGEGRWFVVCKYAPRGNVPRKFPQNVLPLVDIEVPDKLQELRKVALDAFNERRRRHGVPDVSMDDKVLMEVAQHEAERLATFGNNTPRMVSHYTFCSLPVKPIDDEEKEDEPGMVRYAVDYWYRKNEHYDFNKPGTTPGATAFVSMVWKSSDNIGFGWAWDDVADLWYAVAIYTRNVATDDNSFKENVLELVGNN